MAQAGEKREYGTDGNSGTNGKADSTQEVSVCSVISVCSVLSSSQHPQLRPQRLFDFVQQDQPNHPPVEINPRERGHSRTQQSFAVLNRQFDAIGGLALLIGFAFAAD